MKGYTEVNYCVYIKDGDKYYKFAKQSIVNNDTKYEPCHEPIINKDIYDIFYMLYPILKKISRNLIIIQRAWDSWHPLNANEQMPKNVYNKVNDEFITKCYKNWNDTRKTNG